MVRFPRARYTARCSSTEKENKRGDLLLVSGRNAKKKKGKSSTRIALA